MVYRDLDEIKMRRFIDIFCGDVEKVVMDGSKDKHSREEMEKAADKLCCAYVELTGGKTMKARLTRRNEMLKLEMRLASLDACRKLMIMGKWEEVASVMEKLGHKMAGDHESVRRKIESLIASDSYRLEKLYRNEMEKQKNSGEKVTKETFAQERVWMMAKLKMHIDTDVYTAMEYGMMVNQLVVSG